ncbi:rad, Gem/Kir family member 1 isoform 3-T4 [Glossina fuscipes fuscipes]
MQFYLSYCVNTEGIRSALARFRNRTGPTLPQPSPSVSQQPLPVETDLPFQTPPEQQNNLNGSTNHVQVTSCSSTPSEHKICEIQSITVGMPTKRCTKEGTLKPLTTEMQTMTCGGTSKGIPKTKPSASSPVCFRSTRSAAMVALALRNQSLTGANSKIKSFHTINATNSAESTFSKPPTIAQSNANVLNAHVNGVNDMDNGENGSSGSDNDGVSNSSSSSATALRRLHFKSGGRSSKNILTSNIANMSHVARKTVTTNANLHHVAKEEKQNCSSSSSVPKVIVMGSSSGSIADANINTSTDSASTMITNITHTDTSETVDSLDFDNVLNAGDNSGQSETIFSSLEEPLLTAIQMDSEIELTHSSGSHSRHDLRDSIESQESCLSITGEPSSTTPLLSTFAKHSNANDYEVDKKCLSRSLLGGQTGSFDKPSSPKSASNREKLCRQFSENARHLVEENMQLATLEGKMKSFSKKRSLHQNHHRYDGCATSMDGKASISLKDQATVADISETGPKHLASSSKINSAPPTLKDSNFFGNDSLTNRIDNKLCSSSAQNFDQRNSSSTSSSESSTKSKDGECIMFPFDREALDYERIQRECYSANQALSSSSTTSESEEVERCSVYERKLANHLETIHSNDIYQHYTLLSKYEQREKKFTGKRNKRLKSDGIVPKYLPPVDAFYPQPKPTSPTNSQCSLLFHANLNKFDDIASKFDQMPRKHGSNADIVFNQSISPSNVNAIPNDSNNDIEKNSSKTNVCMTASFLNLRPDAYGNRSGKKSYKSKNSSAIDEMETAVKIHEILGKCQLNSKTCNSLGNVSGTNSGESINVTANPMETAVCTQPRATIVVQQPSLSLDNTVETLLISNENEFVSVEQDKETTNLMSTNKKYLQPGQQQQQQSRADNIKQLLDVTSSLTLKELRDFEMRYGSPHHSRSQSVKALGSRGSGRPNQLCLPQQRFRVASMPNTGVEEEYYRLRHFSITGKGVINRGDSLRSRRSRSNNSVASSNSSNELLTTTRVPAGNSSRNSANCSLVSSRESSTSNPGNGPYRVLMLGATAVGKSSLVSQFMTSEYLHAYDTSIDDSDSGEKSVSVLLSGEESELIFIDHPCAERTPNDCLNSYDPHGYCVIYSAADRNSFNVAEQILQILWTNQNIAQKAVILVANKSDLARSRLVSIEEGKAMATAYDCKFIETSVGINHNVDELLVGLLSQIRLKLENPEKSRDLFRKRSVRKSKRRACSPLSGACLTGNASLNSTLGPLAKVVTEIQTPPASIHSSPRKYRGTRTSASLKVKGLLGRVWARDSKSKSCENLHVL